MPKNALRKITVAFLVPFTLICFWQSLPQHVSQEATTALTPPVSADVSGTFDSQASATSRIQDIRVGQRVLAHNPEVDDETRRSWGDEPDFSQWLQLTLEMPKSDGSTLNIEIIRSEEWVNSQLGYVVEDRGLDDQHAAATEILDGSSVRHILSLTDIDSPSVAPLSPLRPVYRDVKLVSAALETRGYELVGLTVQMDLPELGLTGEASVLNIQACPIIQDGDGQVVTATFHHSSGDVIDLVVADRFDQQETFGTTSNHPFWSVDRDEYVQAGSLDIGERVQTLHGDTKTVVSNLPRPGPPVAVYNLEVHGEHVYYVGSDGVLVHNSESYVYAAIRRGSDNEADSVAYVGKGTLGRAESIERRVADELYGGRIEDARANFIFRKVKVADEYEARGLEQAFIDALGGPNHSLIGVSDAWATTNSGLWNKVNSFDWNRRTSLKRLKEFKRAYEKPELYKSNFNKLFGDFLDHGY